MAGFYGLPMIAKRCGGVVFATPGGGLMPLSNAEMELLGTAFLLPAVALALWVLKRPRA